MNSKALVNKKISTHEAVQLIFCTDDYVGQHIIKYIHIDIYIYTHIHPHTYTPIYIHTHTFIFING